MVRWRQLLFNGEGHHRRHHYDERSRLLPTYHGEAIAPALPAREVTKVALKLKYQVEQVIPCELEESDVTSPNSTVITRDVVETARQAGGDEYRACVLFCLLVCVRWFRILATTELWDSELHQLRATACEVIAKRIIESEKDQDYLMLEALLKRYSIFRDGEETPPCNVIERAVDLHALEIISSSGYQKCIKYLWHGWLCQDDKDPSNFIEYQERTNPSYWAHFNPDRMRTPIYQNALQIFFSVLFLALYTAVINTVNPSGDLDVVEGLLYLMTLGLICDELNKFRKIGRHYFGFWNAFNSTLYALLLASFVLRIIALNHNPATHPDQRDHFNQLSYNFLAFSAPLFWGRLLLYLDTFRFFGAMLVVLKVMMKESLIFFALLAVVIVGFLQGFVGMDQADPDNAVTPTMILQGMANTVMQNPDFDSFRGFASPFGILLYYLFTFVVMVVLLNILIALYNSAYEDITGNAINEYLALFAHRTLQFVRAPDENVFIAPLNLIEIVFLIIPFEWWLPAARYERLNNYVMGIIYSPLLLLTALLESRHARRIQRHRYRDAEADASSSSDLSVDETAPPHEWEEMAAALGVDEETWERDGWMEQVERSKPNVSVDQCVLEVRQLAAQVEELRALVEVLVKQQQQQQQQGQEKGTGSD
ncbi:hypothetical protein VTO42DRAFT_7229 [Malbranchea cinnamomea]